MKKNNQIIQHIILIFFSVIIIFPFVWMFFTAFKEQSEVFTELQLLPEHFTLQNFRDVLEMIPFRAYMINTIKYVFGLLIIQYITITLAAYAFARMSFPFKRVLFYLVLIQLMIAPQTLIAPNYITIRTLNFLDTITGLSLPYVASAMGIFLLRQAFASIPKDLEDSAIIDGASTEYFITRIAVPLIKPSYIAFGLISIIYHWNEFFWPLIITDTSKSRVLTVGLAMFAESSESAAAWTNLMAATLIVVLPLIILFLLFQKSFINSFMTSGLKG